MKKQMYLVQIQTMPIARQSALSHIQAAELQVGTKVKTATARQWDVLTETLDGMQRYYWEIR